MIQGGAVGVNVSLESASPRMQKVMRKNLNIEKFRDNLDYICKNYPSAVTTLNTMHGFPTETEEEANMTLDFIFSMNWVHFPYTHIVRIFPGTDLEKFALDHGVDKGAINEAIDKSYHEVAPTLPFKREFTEKYKLKFLKEYVLNKERLKKVLPVQMKHFTEDELNQRYSSYFVSRINGLKDVLRMAGIKETELEINCLSEDDIKIPDLSKKIKKNFPLKKIKDNPFKILLINISTHFTKDRSITEYDVVEPPLGLIALQSYLNHVFNDEIEGKIIKSRIDFDSYEEMKQLIENFSPDLIGVSAMTFHKDFFHEAVSEIRKNGYTKTIIVGGPHPTTSYEEVLKDENIDICAIGEGEQILAEVVDKLIKNNSQKLDRNQLELIDGIAFTEKKSDKKFLKINKNIENTNKEIQIN